jgi:hypothetical protein
MHPWRDARVCWALLLLCAQAMPAQVAPARVAAYAQFAAPVPVTITGYAGDAMEPFIAKDGRFLFFNSRNDPSVNTDLYYASRIDDQTFRFEGPVPGVNGSGLDAVASLDADGNFYFISNRSYASTLSTIYTTRFPSIRGVGPTLTAGVSLLRPGWVNFDAEISADGQTLWFDDGHYSRRGALLAARISCARRQGGSFQRDPDCPRMLAQVNTGGLNYAPDISVDGLELFFTRVASTASGGLPAIYRTTRADTHSAFSAPQPLAAVSGFVEAPSLSADGHLLYFHRLSEGTFKVLVMRR